MLNFGNCMQNLLYRPMQGITHKVIQFCYLIHFSIKLTISSSSIAIMVLSQNL